MSPTLEETYDAAVAGAIPGLAAGLALLFAVFSGLHLVMLDGSIRWAMASTAAASAVLLGGFAFLAHRRPLPTHYAQPVTSGLVMVAVGNAALQLVLTEQPRQTSNLMLILVGAGAVLLSMRWLATTLYIIWGVWGVCAFVLGAVVAMAPLRRRRCAARRCSRCWSTTCAARTSATSRSRGPQRKLPRSATTSPGWPTGGGWRWSAGRSSSRPGARATPSHCIFVDIDGLKQVNDALGHAVGDEVIVAVAEALRAATRATDVVARWGGDEFCVVGPGPGMAPLELERRVRDTGGARRRRPGGGVAGAGQRRRRDARAVGLRHPGDAARQGRPGDVPAPLAATRGRQPAAAPLSGAARPTRRRRRPTAEPTAGRASSTGRARGGRRPLWWSGAVTGLLLTEPR